jgi:peptide methionine sulfoxide reductase MsrB
MTCHCCQGFMCPADLFVGRSGSKYDSSCGWRCVACGEIIDRVIVRNRIRARDQRCVRRLNKSRQPVRMMPAIENRV